MLIGGSLVGGLLGARAAALLSSRRGAREVAFSGMIIATAIYVLVRSLWSA